MISLRKIKTAFRTFNFHTISQIETHTKTKTSSPQQHRPRAMSQLPVAHRPAAIIQRARASAGGAERGESNSALRNKLRDIQFKRKYGRLRLWS